MATKTAIAAVLLGMNAAIDSVGASGFLDLYDGTKPASPDVAVGVQVKLSHHALSATAFAAAASTVGGTVGSKTANAIANAVGLAASTATWGRLTKADGTAVQDYAVSSEITLNSAVIVVGQTVTVSALVVTQVL